MTRAPAPLGNRCRIMCWPCADDDHPSCERKRGREKTSTLVYREDPVLRCDCKHR